MKNIRAILVILSVVCTHHVHSQSLSSKIDAYIESYVETRDFSGCIRIVQSDTILYENCFGMADYAFNQLNSNSTKFKIGSISKQMTAMAILKLEESGLLNTEDLLSNFIPDQPNAAKVTLHQLLTHTAGVEDIFDLPGFAGYSCMSLSLKELAEIIIKSDLEFTPGTQYVYSNGGYALLGHVIEIVSGHSYADFMEKSIFEPLGMTALGHASSYSIVQNLATGYDPLGYKDLVITNHIDNSLLIGSGSLYSSIDDLQRWIHVLSNRELLTSISYKKMMDGYGRGYGYGISTYTASGKKVFGHDGRINGFIADYLHYVEEHVSIIILGNVQTGVSDFFRRDIAAIKFSDDYSSSAKTIPPAQDLQLEFEMMEGAYNFGPGFTVFVELQNNRLMARANEGGYSELVLLQDGRFFSRTLYSFIEFRKDQLGRIEKMMWTNNDGNQFEGLKQ